jgi:sirohydrochlorin cobaltochelatase
VQGNLGVLLVGHGTRDAAGQAEFLAAAGLIAEARPAWLVEPCYLELVEPDIAMGIERLARRGATRTVVMPLLLFAAGHAKRDIPHAVADAANRFPELVVWHAEPLGCHPSIVQLAVERTQAAFGEQASRAEGEVGLVLVGRGSSVAEAIADMRRFARLVSEQIGLAEPEVCFAAVAEPSLAEGLRRAAARGWKTIVVQPHLLFAGKVLDQTRAAVQHAAASYPEVRWLLAEYLGPHPLVVDATIERIEAARDEG